MEYLLWLCLGCLNLAMGLYFLGLVARAAGCTRGDVQHWPWWGVIPAVTLWPLLTVILVIVTAGTLFDRLARDMICWFLPGE